MDLPWPADMELSSEMPYSRKNLAALEEFVEQSEVFHHLWLPPDELADVHKAILLYKDVKMREAEVLKQRDLVSQLRLNLKDSNQGRTSSL